jgi:ATP-binding protein involved in chromosome partitioning
MQIGSPAHDQERHDARGSASTRSPGEKLSGIRHVIAVGSGKGGVGKSTVSVNLAFALQAIGGRIGLIDADVLGPSIPVMLGLPTGHPPVKSPNGKIVPAERLGLKVMSMGMLTGDDKPAILRGPMVGKYLKMFIDSVEWGELDYLILDLPPGTGDTQLTVAQSIQLSGAIIVTTPQEVSLKIARRGLRMFETVHVPILGIIENMSTFTCTHCGQGTDIFGHGGGERMSRELGVPFLGAIPLDAGIVTSGDEGRPIVLDQAPSAAALVYRAIAAELVGRLQGLPASELKPFTWTWETGAGEPVWGENDVRAEGSRTTAIGYRQHDARTLSILWQDGKRSDFDVRDLRLACHCALCVSEMSGERLLDPKSIRPDVAPRTISSVGNYALTIAWNDGHTTGIYSFELLRALGERAAAAVVEDV